MGNSVKRNYYKRRIREFIRNNIDSFGKMNEIIFLYNHKETIKYRQIETELKKKLKYNEKNLFNPD